MSSEYAIRIRNLNKCYQIYERPGDRLRQFVLPRLARATGRQPEQYFHDFWAVKDVSLDIRRGETIGIIGRNGSGKSTLLQIICGTLTPTSGSVETHGRVAALLELGAGFNPEFSGRENVYMSAALLGLTREQTDQRFGQIAAFADIGEFIEQPVKTYSSGMYVRLAFAVIAHVDADILVVDEALSVGDAVFTQKCMRFIRAFQKRGTLIFVSHDMGAVQNICSSSIWMNKGQLHRQGASKEVVEAYMQYTLQEVYGDAERLESVGGGDATGAAPAASGNALPAGPLAQANLDAAAGFTSGKARITAVSMRKMDAAAADAQAVFEGGERVVLRIDAHAHEALRQPIIGFFLKDRLGQELFGENTLPFTDVSPMQAGAGDDFFAEFVFRLPMLPNGQYAFTVAVADGDLVSHVQHHWLHDAMILTIASSKVRWGLVGIPFEKVSLTLKVAT